MITANRVLELINCREAPEKAEKLINSTKLADKKRMLLHIEHGFRIQNPAALTEVFQKVVEVADEEMTNTILLAMIQSIGDPDYSGVNRKAHLYDQRR